MARDECDSPSYCVSGTRKSSPELERLRAAQIDDEATESEEEVSPDDDEGVPPFEMFRDFVEEK